MSSMPKGKVAKAGPGFAVKGRDRAALKVCTTCWSKVIRQGTVSIGIRGIRCVLYSLDSAWSSNENVERVGNIVKVSYLLISHGRTSSTWNLALIPLGRIPPGEHCVEMLRLTKREKDFNQQGYSPIRSGIERRIVSGPFCFAVTDEP